MEPGDQGGGDKLKNNEIEEKELNDTQFKNDLLEEVLNEAKTKDDDDVAEKESDSLLKDDFVDETKLEEEEKELNESQLNERFENAKEFKNQGNEEYKKEEYREGIHSYTKALLICPLKEKEFRAILYSNRSAAKLQLSLKELALEDCSKSLEYNPNFIKVLLRRAKLYEETEKLDQALVDYNKILELDSSISEARAAAQRLPIEINERNEKLKEEMMGKLKELGNMVLRPFGLSTENFQLNKDSNSGGYSINFKK